MIFFLLKMIKTEILTKQYLNNQEEERRSIHSRKNFPLQEISATMVKVSRAWLWAWQYCIKGHDWWPNRTKILVAADLIHFPKHLTQYSKRSTSWHNRPPFLTGFFALIVPFTSWYCQEIWQIVSHDEDEIARYGVFRKTSH